MFVGPMFNSDAALPALEAFDAPAADDRGLFFVIDVDSC